MMPFAWWSPIFLICLILKGIGNKTEISVRGQDRLIISTPNQRNEKATQNISSPETTSGSTGGYEWRVYRSILRSHSSVLL